MKSNMSFGWAGREMDRGRLNKRKLVAEVKLRGGTVEDDSAGRWNVLQLIAPDGFLWSEGLKSIRVEWPKGEDSEPACRDAWERISRQKFTPISSEDAELYAAD